MSTFMYTQREREKERKRQRDTTEKGRKTVRKGERGKKRTSDSS